MEKRVRIFFLMLFLTVILILPFISSSSVDSEIQKITHYAEEYETGNIDYVQLRVYMATARENLNGILGATGRHEGGLLKQEQIEIALGAPTEETKWIWMEGEEREKKLDSPVPAWRKIIFDGRKIRIHLEAWPSIFKRHSPPEEQEEFPEEQEELGEIEEGDIIYRLHFNIEFKKPEEQLDISGKIDSIKVLAEAFNADPSSSNAETLAQESVSTERMFENYFRQSQADCEGTMNSIFGSENQRQSQQILLNEIDFYEGENFDAIIRLEMCDECEWNWINLNMNLETRGEFRQPEQVQMQESMDKYKGMTSEQFKTEAGQLLDKIKSSLDSSDFESAYSHSNSLMMLNRAWDESSNNIWEEVQKEFEAKVESMSEQERHEFDQSYGWIKMEQEKRQKVKEIQTQNFNDRKQFYLSLFSGYDKKEQSFTQTDFEKRLVEEFKVNGMELCNNNIDDNGNDEIDCAEDQCGGKICGRGKKVVPKANSTTNETEEIEVDFYCIQKTCQAKEEIIKPEIPVCGNNICEAGEKDIGEECTGDGNETLCAQIFTKGTCNQDCILCPEHPPIECAGKIVFKGIDENGCPLEPTCVEETVFCDTTDDCAQPLCGKAECIRENTDDEKGTCRVEELTECRQAECTEGDKKIEKCNSGEELTTAICEKGIWHLLDNACSPEAPGGGGCFKCGNSCISNEGQMTMGCESTTEDFDCFERSGECVKEIRQKSEEPECVVKSDCGGENDVCSNGKCVTLPEIIPIEPVMPPAPEPLPQQPPETTPETQPEPTPSPEPQEEPTPTTGEFIFNSFQALLYNLGITGKQIDEGGGQPVETVEGGQESGGGREEPPRDGGQAPPPQQGPGGEGPMMAPPDDNQWQQDNQWEDNQGEWQEREDEGRARMEQEQKERCTKDCTRPCVEKCIRDACGEQMQCNVDEESKKCESTCSPAEGCVEKCMSGEENWWQEFQEQDMHKQEKGVFQVGGGCRTEKSQTHGYIWFGGWGDPFERIEPLKQKYYQGNGADWCKYELENLKKQRQEFEKGFNQEFAQWFFEKHLASSAEEWEQSVSGIFEIYWTNIDNIQQAAGRMKCTEDENYFADYNLINFAYESEYGKIEYWEELKPAKMPGMESEITVPTPYMKVWLFPSKEFMKYEMRNSMKNHEFPGPPEEKAERKNQEGPTEQEREMIKQDEKFMSRIREISEKYGGNLGISLQFKDYETNEVVFNIYGQINENDIIKMQPMPVEEMPDKDVTIEIDFEKIYEMVHMQEKEMRGEETQFPPWEEQERRGGLKDIRNGVKSSFKINSIISSAKVYPEESEKDVKAIFRFFMKMASKGGEMGGPPEGFEKGEGFTKEDFEKLPKEEQERIMSEFGGKMPSEEEMKKLMEERGGFGGEGGFGEGEMEGGFGDFGDGGGF